MNNNYKEVRFDEYCTRCKFEKEKEFRDPCNECLQNFFNLYSHEPIMFKEKEKKVR